MEDFTQRMHELEERIDFLEKKFNINRSAPDDSVPDRQQLPKTAKITTDGDK